MTSPRISRKEMGVILAPLTILPGSNRMTDPHWAAYHAVLKDYYPHELREASKFVFSTSKFWPMPEALISRMQASRRSLGSNWSERLEVIDQGRPDPGPMALLTEAERADIVMAIPTARRIGHAKSRTDRR